MSARNSVRRTHNRLRGGLIALVGIVSACATAPAADGPLVDLDAAALRPGPLLSWPNGGSLAGSFEVRSSEGPVVATVADRAAVKLSEKMWLRSTFPAPASIARGRSFTLAVWAHPAKLVGKMVIASWAPRPHDCAEFGYGKGREGAFCGWRRDVAYRRPPRPGRWHHLAWTYADGRLRVYVDGDLDTQVAEKLTPAVGEPMLLGAAWDARKKVPCFGFRGSLARVRVWDRCLSHREVRNDMGAVESFAPEPADGSAVLARRVILRWRAGHPRASRMRVYLSPDRRAVEEMASSAVRADRLPAAEDGLLDVGKLTLGKTYYWRVEQCGTDGKRLDRGNVWGFDLSAGPADQPRPRHRVASIGRGTGQLCWKPGPYAVSQRVYFGTDPNAVARGEAPTSGDLPPAATHWVVPVRLGYGTRYYWRVAQNNGPLPPAPGRVWTFRTEDKPEPGKLTFFVVSDTHYGLDWRVEPAVQALIDRMNFMPGTALPKSVGGGVIRTPRGVIHLGDMTNDGKRAQWEAYVRDFGLRGEGRLAFPVYDMFGNHDGGADLPVRQGLIKRIAARSGLAARSANGVHYSWQWEGIRFINLNISVGTTTRPYDPQNSFGFLTDELKRLTDKSQPLILLHHFGFDKRQGLRWWPEEWRTRYHEAIRGYNVVAIFHGHDHETDIFRWRDIDVFDAPHIRDADAADKPVRHGFFVVQIDGERMIVAERKLDGTWGLTARKRIAGREASR
jgi:hypothetical protein